MTLSRWGVKLMAGLGVALMAALPAAAATRIVKQLELAPGGRLIVESDLGNVTVQGGAPSGASIVLTADRNDLEKDYEMTFTAAAGTAHVTIKRRQAVSWFGLWSNPHEDATIAVSVPRATAATVRLSGGNITVAALDGETDLRSSGGSIHAHDLSGRLTAKSSGGNVEARAIRGDVVLASSGGEILAADIRGEVDAASSGGGVDIARVSGGVHGRSSGGNVTIRDAGGRVVAGSSGGSVKVGFAPGNAHGGEVQSSGGSVEVRLDPAVGLNLDAASSGGTVTCKLPVTSQGKVSEHRLEGVLKGGGQPLRVRSSGGEVEIRGL
jgi:hypothetical protein